MTNAPNSGNEPQPNSGNQPEPNPPKKSRRRLQRIRLFLGVVLLLGVGVGITSFWVFMQRMLAPMVEGNLEKLLNRPVSMGKVESFSVNGVRFGATEVPATPTDPDRVSIEAVDVAFNPVQLLFKRTLAMDITLIEPDVYIEQDEKRQWVGTAIQAQEKGAIDVKMEVLRLRNADVVLVPRSEAGKLQAPVVAILPSGQANFLNDNQLIQFDLDGQLAKGGEFRLRGESRPKAKETKLAVAGSDLRATEIGRLLQLPLGLSAGLLDGNLEILIPDAKPLQFLGTAALKNVTGKLAQLPQPFAKTNGQLRFKGTQIRLEKITTLFGQIPAQANGIVDTQAGVNLLAQTQPVQLTQVLRTFDVKKLPVAASGEVQAALRVSGSFDKTVVSGAFATTKPTLIDRVNFRSISSGFGIVNSTVAINNFRAVPMVGGVLTGRGQVKLGKDGGMILDIQATNIPGDAIAKNYNVDLPVPIGAVSARTQIFGPLDNTQNIRATGVANLNVAGGKVSATNIQVGRGRWQGLVQATNLSLGQLSPQLPSQFQGRFNGTFNVSGRVDSFQPETILANGSGNLNVAGGLVSVTNAQLNNGRAIARVQADGVRLERLAEVPPQFRGPLSGEFNLAVNLDQLSASGVGGTGSGSINLAGGRITASNVELGEGLWRANVKTDGVQLGRLFPQIPPQLQTAFAGSFNLSGSLDQLGLSTINGSGQGDLIVAGGTVRASDVKLSQGRWQTSLQATGVQLGRLVPQISPQLRTAFTGSFNLSGSLEQLGLESVNGSGSGRLNVGGGTVTASGVQLGRGRWRADVEADSVQLAGLVPQLPPQFAGPFTGAFNLSGSLEQLGLTSIDGRGRGRLNVAGGTVTATNVQLRNGNVQALVEPSGVELARFSQELNGRVGGSLNVSANLANLTPAALGRSLRAAGQLNFSEGLSIIDRPLTTSVRWTGQGLEIQQASAEGFTASGFIGVNLDNLTNQGFSTAIGNLNLDVAATGLNLAELPIPRPNAATGLTVAGLADFDGNIAGTVSAPRVNGNLALRDFVVQGLAFDSPLAGQVQAEPGRGVNVQLAGANDRIEVALGSNYQPISFLIRQDEAIAQGRREGESLLVSAQNFPIGIIKELTPLPTAIAAQPLSGRLSGDVAVNLNTLGITGNVAIADPIFGTLRGDSFKGNFQYTNGVIALTGGEFLQGDNQYLLSGNLTQTTNGPEFNGKLEVAQGDLQDVLTALQLFDLNDLRRGFGVPGYDKAADIAIVPVGMQEAPLQTQLRSLSENEALLAQQREQRDAASPLPEISEAKGRFTGTVNVVGSMASGINAEFDIQGQNWEWGPYSAETVIAQGGFQDGVLTLLPLRFKSDESLASFTGTIGGDAQTGQLRLENIPIDQLQAVLQDVTELPPTLIGFTGFLNATATISGSMSNPQARGDVTLTDATINQTKVQSAQGSFNYNDSRLNFGSTVLIAETDPLRINGSVPYKLPFASVAPTNNQLNLNVDVQNEGLALLNLATGGQVTWIDGAGDVQLAISGTVHPETNRPSQLVAEGVAVVDNATIQSRALPDPLTNVTGRVLFDFDRIQVETVQGQFGEGTVTAAGIIPISQPIPQDNPLRVNIGELALNLKGLYSGGVRGDVVITGTALAPRIGGEVELFNGQVPLASNAGAGTGGAGGAGGAGGESETESPIAFNGLKLTLDKGIQIRQDPILNFLADGTLTINGSLGNLSPEGTIRLQRGQVNLFTTQFRLARGYENTAQFVPNRGLDPELNVRLEAAVAEATQRRLPTDPLSAEISDNPTTGFGRVQTVRVQARVEGPASQLADNLELTSTPSRSETEIVALLGGGFVDTLGRGDSTLGLANLAGSALLGNVQNVIGDALGLSEFRLFPTIITDDERETSSLGLSAEAGIDIGRDFSVSVLKELTNDQPFQYSLRYRLNEEILLRGTTDLSGTSAAVVEYEKRF